jgi:hypothetical protein
MLRNLLLPACFCLCAGYALASFIVLLANHWYFTEYYWPKVALLTCIAAVLLGVGLLSSWRALWLSLGCYWIAVQLAAALCAHGPDLRTLHFVAVLDLEAAMLWPAAVAAAAYGITLGWRAWAKERSAQRGVETQLKLRRRLRRVARKGGAVVLGLTLLAGLSTQVRANDDQASSPEPPSGADYGFIPGADDAEPQHVYANRHDELADPALRLSPDGPALPGVYPTPMHLRQRNVFFIVIENKRDGAVYVLDPGTASTGVEVPGADCARRDIGRVLVPVTQVNPKGFTASGWAGPGTVCASAVNAIHLKTDHDYSGGRGVIFSLLPVEFADFNPKDYKSYFNRSSSLFTDIQAGTGIFGGQWAPLAGSRVLLAPEGHLDSARPITQGYAPKDGDVLLLRVERLKYNPEWIEFENSFGGLIWVKELGLAPYPIGQVLKPVAGVGRFLGSQYAGIGRIRAAHPGVLCISTSPVGTIGGFQIIPRDHAMSPEMTNARVKTQWMVVGPLWALDPSWEGLPPLFTDYLYPAFTPAFNADGTTNQDVTGAAVFLDRFTVRARYSDAEDPRAYMLLREADGLDNFALKTLTHLRVYFPRG